MRRATIVCCAAALIGAPAAGAAHLQARHQGALASVVTISPPPSVAREYPMHWTHWSAPTRAPSSTSLRAFAGHAIVGLRSMGDLAGVVRDYALGGVETLPSLRAAYVDAGNGSLQALLTRGRHDLRIRYIAPNGRAEPFHARNDPLTTKLNPDTGVPYEWEFASSHVDLALNLSHGSPTIVVGDVDSGITDVPDLTNKIAERWYAPDFTDASDPNGHGTAVSSLIAANRDDGYGMAGFGGDTRVIVYKTTYSIVDIAAGIAKVVSRGVRIVNLSLGSMIESPLITDAVNAAESAGVLVVAATGNNAANNVAFPAATVQPYGGGRSLGLAVGASNAGGSPSFFTNIGNNLSLLAPGNFSNVTPCTGVLAAIPTPAPDWDGTCFQEYLGPDSTRYANVAGTSFSSPEVAGVAALIWAVKPELKNYEVAQIIKDSAARPAGSSWSPTTGWGVLDAAHALEEATGRSSADQVVVTPTAAPLSATTRLTETAAVSWSDSVPVAAATVVCTAAAGRTSLVPSAQSFANGVATCTWDLPASLGGRTVTGTIAATETASSLSGLSSFTAAVTDNAAPTIHALASSGRHGASVALRFDAADSSGSVSVHAVVYRGAAVVFRATTPLEPTATHTLTWQAPGARTASPLRFCVTAKDRAGNESASSCAPISLR
ncbi:MAG: S8 family peptidase [Gaiellaceae bacterium]